MRKAVVRYAVTKGMQAGRSEVVRHGAAAAGEMLRVRRDPGVAAARRVRSARRRVSLWSAASLVPAAGVVSQFVSHGGAALASSEVLRTVLYLAVLLVCVGAVVRATMELRQRKAVQRSLPPPAPARKSVAPPIRSAIKQLGDYSDGLRGLLGSARSGPGSLLSNELRLDILASADAAERRIRERAAELTGLAAVAASAGANPTLRGAADELAKEIARGVAEYGEYVSAASDIVVAGRTLLPESGELAERTEQLRYLAVGLRELAD